MKIASIKLRNFKRFTDLAISDVPETAKLVLAVGPNGCGKSSLFDALLHWYRMNTGFGIHSDELYYRKDPIQSFQWHDTVTVALHGNASPKKGSLYVRTAYRNDPDFTIGGLNRPSVPSDSVRVARSIDNDQAVSDNYHRLVYETMSGVYDPANDRKMVGVLREELIGEIRTSMKTVFGDLVVNNISDPLGSGAFFFEKGTIKNYHYKNLSGGEKAAFDLLLDLHVKRKFFADAIYCVDEIETHLHTRVQGALLKEMVKILPATSQLWVTTHSLGVMRAAQELAAINPSQVCVIDFDGANLDEPRQLGPSSLGRVAWEKLLSVALDDLSPRISPEHVIICEGSSIGNRRKDFDAEIYNRIFGDTYGDIVFVSGGSSNEVEGSGENMRRALTRVAANAKVWTLMDHDDKSLTEIAELEKMDNMVLSRRNLESYLFSEEVIEALVNKEGKPQLLADALKVRSTAIANSKSRGNAPDDLKSAAGEIYTELKKLLGLVRCGNSTDAFMRDTLAPLITPAMTCHSELKALIINRLT